MQQQDTNSVCVHCKGTKYLKGANNTLIRCKCYYEEIRLQRIKNIGIPISKAMNLKDYKIYDNITKTAKNEAMLFVEAFKNNTGEGICFLGQAGAGKTALTLGIIKELIKDYSIIYMPFVSAIMDLQRNTYDNQYITNIMSKYIKCDLLIIDDLFKEILLNGEAIGKPNRVEHQYIYDIINYRYINNKPMIINSEALPETLMNIDAALAGRLFERNSMIMFEGQKYNYRLRNFR